MNQPEEKKLTLTISEKNWQVFLSAFELKIKHLRKLQNELVKANQTKAANELEMDLGVMRRAIEALRPLKPVHLPLTPRQ